MYSEIFEGGRPELGREFETVSVPEYVAEEEQDFLMEARIEKPYTFCESVKHSKGPEKKIMDFKTGIRAILRRNNHSVIRVQGGYHNGCRFQSKHGSLHFF